MLVFEPLHPDVAVPRRETSASAGYDLAAYLKDRTVRIWTNVGAAERGTTAVEGVATLVLEPGERALIPLGFKARLPDGVEAQVRPRSGTSVKTSLVVANAPGTIDPDYAEEWCVPVRNGGTTPLIIRHGDRIAQAVFARFEALEIVAGSVRRSTERAGGFGSTGASVTDRPAAT